MKFLKYPAFIFLLYFIYGFVISRFEIQITPKEIAKKQTSGLFEYRGVTNVLSNLSSGIGDYRHIVESAKNADLDFIFITDHNLFTSPALVEGYHDQLLVLFAHKYSYLDSRLLYYAETKAPLAANLGEAQVKLTDIISQSRESRTGENFIVLTHPLDPNYAWGGEIPVGGIEGIEVINLRKLQTDSWKRDKLVTLKSLFVYPFNPKLAFLSLLYEPKAELNYWLEQNKKRKITGHLGLEANSKAIPFTGGDSFNFPGYEQLFTLASHHVFLKSELTGNPVSDKLKLLRALRNGEFFMAIDLLGSAKGFSALLKQGKKEFLMGNEVSFKKGSKLLIRLGAKPNCHFEIRVYKEADIVGRIYTQEGEFNIDAPGLYRVAVYVKPHLPFPEKERHVPWILSNYFYVR